MEKLRSGSRDLKMNRCILHRLTGTLLVRARELTRLPVLMATSLILESDASLIECASQKKENLISISLLSRGAH